MIELIDGIDFHNFMLDQQSKEWFKRTKEETVIEWLVRVSYKPIDNGQTYKDRLTNQEYYYERMLIEFKIFKYLKNNNIELETLIDTLGFEFTLNNKYDFTLKEIFQIQKQIGVKLI